MKRADIDGEDRVTPITQDQKLHSSALPQRGHDDLADMRRLWVELPPLRLDARNVEQNRIVTAARADARQAPLDILRTKITAIMRVNGWSTLAITSPTAGCGKTTLALDLAFSMAKQTNFRVALLDFDLRRPAIARFLGIQPRYSIEKFLRGQSPLAQSFLRHGNSLAIAPNSEPVMNAAELLRDQAASTILADLRGSLKLDLVIFDLPPMLPTDDVLAFLPAVDGVLLVVAAEQSSFNEIDVCERSLDAQGKLLGVVLNKCRYSPEKYGY